MAIDARQRWKPEDEIRLRIQARSHMMLYGAVDFAELQELFPNRGIGALQEKLQRMGVQVIRKPKESNIIQWNPWKVAGDGNMKHANGERVNYKGK